MSTPQLPPWSWGRATAAYNAEWFERRIRRCDSIEHLRAAVKREADRHETRPDRVARINQRIQELQS
jgi:hypothetical protein